MFHYSILRWICQYRARLRAYFYCSIKAKTLSASFGLCICIVYIIALFSPLLYSISHRKILLGSPDKSLLFIAFSPFFNS